MFGFISKLFSTNKKPVRKSSFKPQFDTLERREVMTTLGVAQFIGTTATNFETVYTPPAPTAAGLAVVNSLPNATVRATVLADYQRDGQVTRNDMIDAFYSASNGFTYLLPGALPSLQTLVNNGPTLDMPDSVHYLSSKVIAGVSGLGQAPAGVLDQHVNNFFLGAVHPNGGSYATYTQTGPSSAPATYELVNEPLWNAATGPTAHDVSFTDNIDPNVVLTLADVANYSPGSITSAFINNGDGTYTVRLNTATPNQPAYVTVDSELPFKASNLVDSHGNSVGQVPVGGAVTGPYLWPALLEKAIAQENGLSYTQLGNVSAASVWTALTGMTNHASASVNPTAIAAAAASGNDVVLHGNNTVAETTTGGTFYFKGDFVILGVPSASANWFSLRRAQDTGYVVEVPPSQMASFFSSWYYESAAASTTARTKTQTSIAAVEASQFELSQDTSLGIMGVFHAGVLKKFV